MGSELVFYSIRDLQRYLSSVPEDVIVHIRIEEEGEEDGTGKPAESK